MDKAIIKNLAAELYDAQFKRKPIKQLTERYPDMTIEDAYSIQLEVVRLKEAAGLKIIGKKIGLTNKAIRDQVGVQEPDYGIITSEGLLADGGVLEMDKYIAPRIEPEIAFIIGKDLPAGKAPFTSWDICTATLGIAASLEIVDSRIIDWKLRIQDTVADSASYGAIVLSNRITPLDKLDLRVLGMSAYKNGELVACGSSGNVMGNPINAVVWLANKLQSFGVELKAGDVILSGSFTPVFDIHRGDSVNVIFDHLGEVSLRMV